MEEWLDTKGWRPHNGEALFCKSIATRIDHTLKELALERGLDAERFPTHSLRAGCATTLYAAGIDPIDIQRWGRWKSGIYMRYIRHDNVRLQHLSTASTSTTKLMERLKVDVEGAMEVGFEHDYRDGSSGKPGDDLNSTVLNRFDFFSPPEADKISGSQSALGSNDSRFYRATSLFIQSPKTGNDGIRGDKSDDFLSSVEPRNEVKVQYEEEPGAVGVELEEDGNGLLGEEIVKRERNA